MPILAILGLALKGGATTAFKWLCHRSFWQLACMGLALFAVVQHFSIAGERRHSAKVERQLKQCGQARHADREAYRKAQADAQAKNNAQVKAVEQQQKGISDATVALLNDRLARLRRELQSTPQGPPRSAGPPKGGPTPKGADGKARVCLAPPELLRGAENEERHDRLIDWVEQQSKIDPNKP